MKPEYITLKWGTLKSASLGAWSKPLFDEHNKLGSSASAMTQKDRQRQKEIICELIDKGSFETVYLDWDGEDVSKEEAKKYVMEYDTNTLDTYWKINKARHKHLVEMKEHLKSSHLSLLSSVKDMVEQMKKPRLTKPIREGVIGTTVINHEYNQAISDIQSLLDEEINKIK